MASEIPTCQAGMRAEKLLQKPAPAPPWTLQQGALQGHACTFVLSAVRPHLPFLRGRTVDEATTSDRCIVKRQGAPFPGPDPSPKRFASSAQDSGLERQEASPPSPKGSQVRSLRVQDGSTTARGQQTPGAQGPSTPERAAQTDGKFSVAYFVPSQPATTTLRHPEEFARCRSHPAWVAGGETVEKYWGQIVFLPRSNMKTSLYFKSSFFSPSEECKIDQYAFKHTVTCLFF